MTSLLKPKNIRRIIVALALLAPIGYLFGTQIATLAGAHGEQIIGNNVYQTGERLEKVDNIVVTGDYHFTFFDTPDTSLTRVFDFDFTCNGVVYDSFSTDPSGSIFFRRASDASILAVYSVGAWVSPVYKNIVFTVSSLPSDVGGMVVTGDLYLLVNFDGRTEYADYLFSNMFGESNFLTEWGADALSVNRRGFVPVGELFSYVDENVLHLSNTNIGLMGYGYMYYVVHVLLLDLVAMAFVFIVSIPERILDQINGKSGGDW